MVIFHFSRKKIRRVKISSDCGLQDCVALGFHRDDLSVARRCWKASMENGRSVMEKHGTMMVQGGAL